MSLANIKASYAPARMGRKYGYRDPKVYTMKGYHRAQDIRKLDPSGRFSVVSDVHSLSAGKVVYIGRPNDLIELTIVVDTGRRRGRYEWHSHNAEPVVKIGQKVGAGQKLCRNAAADENPGTAWSGPHDHMGISDYIDGAWRNRPEYDPLPFIREALAAVDKPKPTPKPAGVSKPKPTKITYYGEQVTTADVNLRAEPSTKAAILGVVPKATVVKNGAAVNGWHPVKWGTKTGYIRGDYIVVRKKTVASDKGLNLRKTPSEKGKNIITGLRKGTKVTVLSVLGSKDNARWWRVRAGIRTGWVDSRFLA